MCLLISSTIVYCYKYIKKDIVHVWAALRFGAESLDIKFANFFDEIIVTLNMLELAFATLYPNKKKIKQ